MLGTLHDGHLARLVNPGIVFHQKHFHGNHIWTVSRNNEDGPRHQGFAGTDGHVVLKGEDGEHEQMDRKDINIPIKRSPDAIDPVWFARTTDWVPPHALPRRTVPDRRRL